MDTERGGAGEQPWWLSPGEAPASPMPDRRDQGFPPPLAAHAPASPFPSYAPAPPVPADAPAPPAPSYVPAPPAPSYAPAPPPMHAPMPPRHRRRPIGRLLMAALLCTALAVGLGLVAAHRYAARSGPESIAHDFFTALAAGDAPAALALADQLPRGPWLTGAVLRRQLQAAPITAISVFAGARTGTTATVRVRYQLRYPDGVRQLSDTVGLVRHGSSWRLARVAAPVRVTAGAPDAGRLRLAGRRLPAAAVLLFPGALPLTADPPALQAATTSGTPPVIRLADPALTVRARLAIPPALRAQAVRAVQELLARCLAAGSHDPLCPLPVAGRPVPGTLHGSAAPIAAGSARVVLRRGGSVLLDVRARLSVQGSWQAWDYQNQVVTRQGSATVDLAARVSPARPTEAFWEPS